MGIPTRYRPGPRVRVYVCTYYYRSLGWCLDAPENLHGPGFLGGRHAPHRSLRHRSHVAPRPFRSLRRDEGHDRAMMKDVLYPCWGYVEPRAREGSDSQTWALQPMRPAYPWEPWHQSGMLCLGLATPFLWRVCVYFVSLNYGEAPPCDKFWARNLRTENCFEHWPGSSYGAFVALRAPVGFCQRHGLARLEFLVQSL